MMSDEEDPVVGACHECHRVIRADEARAEPEDGGRHFTITGDGAWRCIHHGPAPY